MKKFAPAVGFIFGLLLIPAIAFGQATLLPNAVQQYFDSNGAPVAGGSIDYYVPGTTTRKNTWKDSGKTQLNTNPLVLDAAGRPSSGGNAIGTYGDGSYRQVLKDVNNNTIWDATTASTGTGGGGGGTFGIGVTVGTILPTAAGTVPASNYKLADGSTIVRIDYPEYVTAVTITYATACVSGNPTISGLADTLRINVGAAVEATCFPPGTLVLSKTANSITMTNNATTSGSFSVVIFPWGNGNGSTTITLPDLRGKTLFGRNNMSGSESANLTSTYYGANPNAIAANTASPAGQSRSLTQSNLPNVNFAVTTTTNAPNVVRTAAGGGFTANVAAPGGAFHAFDGAPSAETLTSTGTAASGGTATAFSVVNPGITVDYIVKVAPDTDAGACPPPSAITLGCILQSTAPANQFVTGVDASGNLIYSGLPNMAAATIRMNPTTSSAAPADYTIQGLTAIAAADTNLDFLPIYDHITGEIRKVTPGQIASGGVAGVSSLISMTGAIGSQSGSGLAANGSNIDTSYNQGGTNAVARQIPNRLQDTISIADFAAGGTANDTSGVQAAFNACGAQGGCQLICRGGITYTVDTLTVSSLTTFDGAGCFFQQRTQGTYVFQGTGASNVKFKNVHCTGKLLSGSGLASPIAGDGCFYMRSTLGVLNDNADATDIYFDRVYITRFGGLPLQVQQARRVYVTNSTLFENAFGIWFKGVNYFGIENNICEHTAMYSLTPTASQLASCIGLESTDQNPYGISTRGTIKGNKLLDFPYSQAIFAHAARYVTMADNVCFNVSICVSLNAYNTTDSLDQNIIKGNVGEGTFASSLPTSSDVGITIGAGGCTTGCPLIGTVVGGSGYVDGIYLNVPLTGGSGTGATAHITVQGGAVRAFALLGVLPVNPGSGYIVGNVLSASAANLGGAGSGFTYTLTSVTGGTAPNPTGNVVSDNTMHAFNRVSVDTGLGCYTFSFTFYTTITNNVAYACGGNGFVFVAEEQGMAVSGNTANAIVAISTTQRGFSWLGSPRAIMTSNMASGISGANGIGYRVAGATANFKWKDSGTFLLNGVYDVTTASSP